MRAILPPGARLGFAASVLLVLTVGACSAFRPPSPFENRDQAKPQIRINVVNLNFADATLTARRGAESHRLGTVAGKGQASYVLEWPLPLALQIEISLLAGGSCRSTPLYVDPGDIVDLQIQVQITRGNDCAQLNSRRGD